MDTFSSNIQLLNYFHHRLLRFNEQLMIYSSDHHFVNSIHSPHSQLFQIIYKSLQINSSVHPFIIWSVHKKKNFLTIDLLINSSIHRFINLSIVNPSVKKKCIHKLINPLIPSLGWGPADDWLRLELRYWSPGIRVDQRRSPPPKYRDFGIFGKKIYFVVPLRKSPVFWPPPLSQITRSYLDVNIFRVSISLNSMKILN